MACNNVSHFDYEENNAAFSPSQSLQLSLHPYVPKVQNNKTISQEVSVRRALLTSAGFRLRSTDTDQGYCTNILLGLYVFDQHCREKKMDGFLFFLLNTNLKGGTYIGPSHVLWYL